MKTYLILAAFSTIAVSSATRADTLHFFREDASSRQKLEVLDLGGDDDYDFVPGDIAGVEEDVHRKFWDFVKSCDSNNNGKIDDAAEIQCVRDKMNPYDDTPRDDKFDKKEIERFIREALRQTSWVGTIAKEILKRYDANRNGVLDPEEIENLIRDLGTNPAQNPTPCLFVQYCA